MRYVLEREAERRGFRAARTMQLVAVGAEITYDHPSIMGCDLAANTILERLKKDEVGLKLVQETNPQLLRD